MPERARTMWMLLFAIAALGGCGGHKSLTETASDYERGVAKRIKRAVDDDDRRDTLLRLEREVNAHRLQIERLYVDLGKKIRENPDLTPAQIKALTDGFSADRKQLLLDIGGFRMEMREHATPEEWQKIFPPEEIDR